VRSPLLILLAAGCAGGPPAEEAKAFPGAVHQAEAEAVLAAGRAALEAAGMILDRTAHGRLVTRRREEPEGYSWTLELAVAPRGRRTSVDAVLNLERASLFDPFGEALRNRARMQADDAYLESKNRPAYERDVAGIEAESPEGRREAAIGRLEARVRALLADLAARLGSR
jgi:hypothetical protein